MFNNFSITNVNGYTYLALLSIVILLGALAIVAFSYYIARYILIPILNKIFNKSRIGSVNHLLFKNQVYHRLAYLVPAYLLYRFSYLFNIDSLHFKLILAPLIKELTSIYLLIGIALVFSAILNCINERYNYLPIAKHKPIKSYLQVIKIFLFALTGIYIAAVILDKSPTYLFTGIGAVAAFLAFIFKDSIMGCVASIQLAAYDMVRIGDWIEMPNFGADGEVIDISLNTIKVQNADKTIITIPSYALLTSSLKNWRGMLESGSYRIKHTIFIDITSFKYCDITFLDHIAILNPTLVTNLKKNISTQSLTNIGLFRSYLYQYLKEHAHIHQNMKILVRQLQGTPTGLPLELYFYLQETHPEKYEIMQSDIIEYIYTLLPYFDLRVFQYKNTSL